MPETCVVMSYDLSSVGLSLINSNVKRGRQCRAGTGMNSGTELILAERSQSLQCRRATSAIMDDCSHEDEHREAEFSMSSYRNAGALWAIASTGVFAQNNTAQNYTATQLSDNGVSIVRLRDAAHEVEVSIVPSIGNRAYEMK